MNAYEWAEQFRHNCATCRRDCQIKQIKLDLQDYACDKISQGYVWEAFIEQDFRPLMGIFQERIYDSLEGVRLSEKNRNKILGAFDDSIDEIKQSLEEVIGGTILSVFNECVPFDTDDITCCPSWSDTPFGD